MIKSILRSFIVICLFWVVFGFTIPNYEWYVTDKVWIFSETQKSDLTSKIEEIEKATSIELAVLVVPTVDDDINLAAVDVGNKRWVGKKGQNNWLVLLIAIDDRKRSIQVGYGLEGILPDIITKKIGEARFPSNFKNQNYYQGVIEMLDDVLWYIKQDPTITAKYSQDSSNGTSFDEDMVWIVFFVVIVVMGWFGRWVTVPSSTGTWRKMKKYGRWMYAWMWCVLSLILTWLIASFVIAFFVAYLSLLFGILAALAGRSSWGIRFGWRGGGFWSWSSGFGWFGGGSFGGGWSSGSW